MGYLQAVWLYPIPGPFPYNNGPLMLRGTIAMPLGSIESNVLALDSKSFVTRCSSWLSANIIVYLVGSSRLKGSGSVQGSRLSVRSSLSRLSYSLSEGLGPNGCLHIKEVGAEIRLDLVCLVGLHCLGASCMSRHRK